MNYIICIVAYMDGFKRTFERGAVWESCADALTNVKSTKGKSSNLIYWCANVYHCRFVGGIFARNNLHCQMKTQSSEKTNNNIRIERRRENRWESVKWNWAPSYVCDATSIKIITTTGGCSSKFTNIKTMYSTIRSVTGKTHSISICCTKGELQRFHSYRFIVGYIRF